MTRPKTRLSLRLESLESRALLSSGGPTAQQQYMLELINMARTEPAEMANWLQQNLDANDMATIAHYGVNLQATLAEIASSTPIQPLAWSDTLASTATEQSQYEADNQVQTHDGPGELDLAGRLSAAGYDSVEQGENSYAYAQSVNHAMEAFLIDWGVPDAGHRGNLLQPNTSDGDLYTEVGIGIVATGPGSAVGPYVMTQDFGRPTTFTPQVVGVVYDDMNGNHVYDPGEGQGGVQIVVDDANGNEVAETTTWDSGGYQIPLSPGNYTVTAVENGQVVKSQNITIANDNVAVNFDTSQPWQGGALPNTSSQSQAPTPVPVVTPVVTPAQTSTPAPTPPAPQVSTPTPVQNSVNSMSTTPPVVAAPSVPNSNSSWLSGWSWWKGN